MRTKGSGRIGRCGRRWGWRRERNSGSNMRYDPLAAAGILHFMKPRHPRLLRLAIALASLLTLLFALSTFCFVSIASHRSPSLSWTSSTSGYGLLQAHIGRGQFHVVIDFAKPSKGNLQEREFHGGAGWTGFVVSTDLRKTDRRISRLGFDAFLNHGTYFSAGVFGLYPAIVAWLVAILLWRWRTSRDGHCTNCGYSLYGLNSDRCPECGTVHALRGQVDVDNPTSQDAAG